MASVESPSSSGGQDRRLTCVQEFKTSLDNIKRSKKIKINSKLSAKTNTYLCESISRMADY